MPRRMREAPRRPPVSRELAAWGGPLGAASFVAGVAAGAGLSDAPYPRPGAPAEAIKRYFSDNAGPARLLTLTRLIEAGKLTPVLDRTYPLADTAEGLRRVEQGHVRGKVVISVP